MKDLNNIEEQFRQQLQQMEVKTSASAEDMWTRIEGQLPSKRRLAWYWIAGGAALLLLGLSIGYHIANEKNIAHPYQGESHQLPIVSKTERSFNSDKKDNLSSPSSASKEPTSSIVEKNSSIKKKAEKAELPHTSNESLVVSEKHLSKKQISASNQKYTVKSSSEKNKTIAPQEKSPYDTVDSPDPTTSNTIVASNALPKEAVRKAESSNSTAVLPIRSKGEPLRITGQQIADELTPKFTTTHQLPVAMSDPAAPRSNPRFQLGFAYQPQITLLRATENTTYPIKYGSGFSAFLLKSKEGYYYSAGFEYNQTRYGYRYHSVVNGEYTYYNQLLSVTYNDDGTLTNQYGDTTVQSTITTDVAYNNVYKQMGVNLEIGKQWALGRSSLLAGIQANVYYIPQQVARYSNSDNYTGVVRSSDKGMKSMILVPAVTAQWRYQIAPKWNVHAGFRLTVLPAYIWNSELGNTLFRPNVMLGVSRTILR